MEQHAEQQSGHPAQRSARRPAEPATEPAEPGAEAPEERHPARNSTRRRSQERTREALLRAAAGVFAKRGFHAATLPEIARAAGCSTGAVYSNFAGKEDLFLALLGWFARALRDELRAAPERVRRQAPEHAAARWIRQLDEHPETMLLLVEFWLYAARNPRVRPRLAERFDQVRDDIADMIALATGVPEARALDAAFAAQALGYGYAMLRVIDPEAEGEDRDRFRRAVTWLHDGVASAPDD